MSDNLRELRASENLSDLPNGWVWTSLGAVCYEPQYGWTTRAVTKGILRLLRTSDITAGHIDWNSVPFCKEEPLEKEKYLLKDGDIVISRAGSVGYSNILKNPQESVFASYLIRFRPLIDELYLAYFLKSPSYWKSISEKSLGIAIPNVNASRLKKISLPLPPLSEQKRIVNKIEELFTRLDAGVEALKKVREQLKRYRLSVLKSAFEGKLTGEWRRENRDKIEPASLLLERIKEERSKSGKKFKELPPSDASELPRLPEGWVWTRVGEIATMIQYGTSEKANTDSAGIPVIRMGNILDGKLILDDVKYFPKDWTYLNEFILNDGDVLFNRTNSKELVGKTAVYRSCHPEAVFASYLIRVKTNKNFYDPDILSYFINSLHGRKYINSVVSQQVGQANVNGTKLSLMPIPLPPILEQGKMAEEVEHLFSIADQTEKTIEQSLTHADRLRQSILKQAFEGKLVPQDPTDEPATVLLGRIKVYRTNLRTEEGKNRKHKKTVEVKQMRLM